MKIINFFLFALIGFTVTILTSCGSNVKTQISSEKKEVNVNEIVKFTNNTTGADTYDWDFGDGETSTDKSPTHSWSSAGTYKVKISACPLPGHGPQRHFGGGVKCVDDSLLIKVN